MAALNFPIRADTAQFDQAMDRARSVSSTATRYITQQFVKMSQDMIVAGATAGAGLTSEFLKTQAAAAASALAIRLAWVAAYGIAVHEIIVLIKSIIAQMQELVEIADKASHAGVDPQFWQAWSAGARNAKVDVKDLQDALQHANDATKDILNPDWSVWDEGRRKITEIEKTMVQLRELFASDQSFTGLDLFRNAKDTPERVRAVLTFMVQLDAIGEHLASLDLGTRMFGAKFVDDIREGKTSAQEMLDTLDKFKAGGDGIWSSKLIEETKDVDRQLKLAHQTLSQDLTPQYEGLVSLANELKSVWTGIVNVLDTAVRVISAIDRAGGRAINIATGMITGMPQSGETLGEQAGLKDIGVTNVLGTGAGLNDIGGGNVPLPRRRPSDAPKPKVEKEEAETADAFETATDAINRQIAALTADAAAVGKTAAEHQQLRVELRLLEAARQSGVEITDKQIAEYATLRASMGAEAALAATGIRLEDEQAAAFGRLSNNVRLVAAALDDKKRAFAGVNEAVRFAGNELVEVIDRATQRGARFGDIMADVMRAVAKQMLTAAIIGEGAFAKLFGTASKTGGTGGLLGLLLGGLGSGGAAAPGGGAAGAGAAAVGAAIPGMADGGTLAPGALAYVSEHGPNPRLVRNLSSEPIMVTPNDVAGGGGGGPNVTVQINQNFGGVAGEEAMARVALRHTQLGMARVLAQVPGLSVRGNAEHAARFL